MSTRGLAAELAAGGALRPRRPAAFSPQPASSGVDRAVGTPDGRAAGGADLIAGNTFPDCREHVQPLSLVLATLEAVPRARRTLIVGIDGRGASGKSTLAAALRDLSPTSVHLVRIDDFYRPAIERRLADRQELGVDFDWRRLRDEVLIPLNRDEPGRYRRYDWQRDALAEAHSVPVGGTVIVEGNYVLRTELRGFYDVTAWVECPYAERLARGIERDGQARRAEWLEYWMPEEDRYVAAEQPQARAHLIVDGRTRPGLDPRSSAVVVGWRHPAVHAGGLERR